MAKQWGLERLGFLTLTFRDHVTEIKEAQRRFNSLRSNVLAKRYAASIAVVERQKSGRIHFHILTVCAKDIRTGFNFDAVTQGNYSSANSWLRHEWGFWRSTAPKFGFGRTELLPVKSTAEGIGKYVGKYIAKHIDSRIEGDKGARLVRYTRDARKCGTRFAWAGVRGWLWRAKLAKVAVQLGCDNLEALRAKYGPRWAYFLAGVVANEVLEKYPSLAHALADGVGSIADADGMAGEVTVKRGVWSDAVPHFSTWGRGSGAKGAPVSQDTEVPGVALGRRCEREPFAGVMLTRAVGPCAGQVPAPS